MNNESLTRAYFFDGKIEKDVFIKDTIKNFVHSQKNQLLLLYCEDISRIEVRHITHRIKKGIRKQNPDVLTRVIPGIPEALLEFIAEVVNADLEECLNIEGIDTLAFAEKCLNKVLEKQKTIGAASNDLLKAQAILKNGIPTA